MIEKNASELREAKERIRVLEEESEVMRRYDDSISKESALFSGFLDRL